MQIFFLTFVYSLLLSLLATTNSARAQSEEPVQAQRTNIKVGVTLPLTGGLSAVGESFMKIAALRTLQSLNKLKAPYPNGYTAEHSRLRVDVAKWIEKDPLLELR